MAETDDLAIVGGGVARDAAGRGLKVYLCEKGDLGGATSCASTKLLHGGLRYLEHYEFRLVRKALQERERLRAIARISCGLISISGGKITTYHRLAEAVIRKLVPFLPTVQAKAVAGRVGWTGEAFADRLRSLRERHPFLPEKDALRLFTYYGTRVGDILGNARSRADLGMSFGAGLTEAEVSYLAREEWAVTGEDIVFRRSKLGLKLTAGEMAALALFLEGKRRSLAG